MIWFNGQLTSGAQLDATNAGALLGWGVFTTLRVRAGAPLLWEYHAARLERDALAARVACSFDAAQLRAGLDELTRALQTRDCLARITGTRRGDGRWNANEGADWSIVIQPVPALLSAPLRLEVSPHRIAARAPLAGVKTTSYLPYLVAWQEARERGFDEALLLTESGWVCETARASIFWFKEGTGLFTPSLPCGCLRGVGREWAIERNRAREGRFRLRDLLDADEVFVISAATGPRSVSSISHANDMRQWEGEGEILADIKQLWDRL